jgi:GTP cyclohydrolase I
MVIDTERIEAAVAEIIAAIGDDPRRAGLVETPTRVAAMYEEFFAGVGTDPREHLARTLELGDAERGELVIVRNIEFRSVCEHHLLPFIGTASVAYVPGDRVVGLGSFAKVLDSIASRPQLQERVTEEFATAIDEALAAKGVLVVLDAVHSCVTARGAGQHGSSTVTMATRGSLATPTERASVLAIIGVGS